MYRALEIQTIMCTCYLAIDKYTHTRRFKKNRLKMDQGKKLVRTLGYWKPNV